jgi:hypothetical protein
MVHTFSPLLNYFLSPYPRLFPYVFTDFVRLPGVAYLRAALGVRADVAHAAVTLETLTVIRGLESGHSGVVAVKGAMAVFARHKAVGDRILKCFRGYLMTLLARKPLTHVVLVMTGSATARDGNMFRVIELHRGVGILDAV